MSQASDPESSESSRRIEIPTNTLSTSTSPQIKQKWDQIVQNYFSKAAHIILHSRVHLPPFYSRGSSVKRTNKWFNIEIDDSNAFREEIRLWRQIDAMTSLPPPLVIQVSLDTSSLTSNQTLVVLCENRIKHRLDTALHGNEIIMEQWNVALLEPDFEYISEVPIVYKHLIILFRSLYTFCRILPLYRLKKKLGKAKLGSNLLKLKCKIMFGSTFDIDGSSSSALQTPLFRGDEMHISTQQFSPISMPLG